MRLQQYILFIFLLVSATEASAQTNETKDKIDSICNLITLNDSHALRIKVKSRNIDIIEWQRFYVDTIENKILKVFARVENSRIGYTYYFYIRRLIRVDENIYFKSGISDSNILYFNNTTFLFSSKTKPSDKKILMLLKRASGFLNYAKHVSSSQRQ